MSLSIESTLAGLFRASWQASILAIVVLVIQVVLGARLGARGRYALWAIVLLRLLLPALPESRWSIFNLKIQPEQKTEIVSPEVPMRSVVINHEAPTGAISTPAVARVAKTNWLPRMLAISWFFGAFLLSIRVAITSWKLQKLVRSLAPPEDSNLLANVDRCATELGLRYRPAVLIGDAIRSPAVIGTFRPVLLIPSRVLAACDTDELRLVLLHELAHLRRHDIAGNWLITIASVLHWFNPLVWLLAGRMRTDRELACDELVLACSRGRDGQAYGRTLLKLIEVLSPRITEPQIVGILETSSPMKRRVQMIARFNPNRSGRWIVTMIALLTLGAFCLTDAVQGQAQPTTQPQPMPQRREPVRGAPARPAVQAEEALKMKLPDLRFDGIAFGDVVEFLRDVSSANIVVEWKVLETAGFDRDSKISLNLRDVTLADGLTHILRNLAGDGPKLSYQIQNGAILISTETNLEFNPDPVFYDVNDLVRKLTSSKDEYDKSRTELILAITQTVSRDDWANNGGTNTIVEYNGKLIVRASAKVHAQVARFLAHLRETPTTQPRPIATP